MSVSERTFRVSVGERTCCVEAGDEDPVSHGRDERTVGRCRLQQPEEHSETGRRRVLVACQQREGSNGNDGKCSGNIAGRVFSYLGKMIYSSHVL